MRARVPEEMKESVLKQLKHMRFWSIIKWFPVVLIIFSVLFGLAIFFKGHALLFFLEQYTSLSKDQILLWGFIFVSVLTCIFTIYALHKHYKELSLETHLYCRACDAVDDEDEGRCHQCGAPLSEQSTFIRTFSKDEVAYLKRLGLTACKEFDWSKSIPAVEEP